MHAVQVVTVYCVTSHVAVMQITPPLRLCDNVQSGQACRAVMHENGALVLGSSRRGKLKEPGCKPDPVSKYEVYCQTQHFNAIKWCAACFVS